MRTGRPAKYSLVRLVESRSGEPRTAWMTSAELNKHLGLRRGLVSSKLTRGGGYYYDMERKEFQLYQAKNSAGEIQTLPTSKPRQEGA